MDKFVEKCAVPNNNSTKRGEGRQNKVFKNMCWLMLEILKIMKHRCHHLSGKEGKKQRNIFVFGVYGQG